MTDEFIYLQTADGNTLYVPDEHVKFLTYGNFGAPPTQFLTRKGYKQHGVTEVDYLLAPRTITAELWRTPACTRQQYWDNRLALHEFLRPNRGGPLWFVLRQPDGTKRALVVRADPGLQFPMPPTEENAWNVNEAIDFVAHDPVWFDPDSHTELSGGALAQQLVFPITFPIWFGSTHILASTTVTYTGTWISYPTLTVFGPYTSCTIKNVDHGETINLIIPIAGGESRSIDLTPGAQAVTDQLGYNRFGDLGVASNLVGFGLYPDPEVAGGVQTITADFVGGIANTSALQMVWHDRYFAL